MFTKNNISGYKPAEKCKSNPSTKFFSNDSVIYCFDLLYDSVRSSKMDGDHFLYLNCEENCTDKNGEPAIIDFIIASDAFKIDHSSVNNPIQNTTNIEGIHVISIINNPSQNDITATYISRMYNTTKIFSTEKESFIDSYYNYVGQSQYNSGFNVCPIHGNKSVKNLKIGNFKNY